MTKKEKIYLALNVTVMLLHLAYTITNLAIISTIDCERIQIE